MVVQVINCNNVLDLCHVLYCNPSFAYLGREVQISGELYNTGIHRSYPQLGPHYHQM